VGGTAGGTGGAGGGAGAGGGNAGTGGGAGAGGGNAGTGGASAACGSSTDPSTGAGCNTLDPAGACVTETLGTGSAPSPAGGTIAAGIYDLTSMTRYAGPDGGGGGSDARQASLAVSSVIANSFALQITEVSGTSVRRQSGTVVASGTQVTFTAACPIGGDGGGTASYTATATSFTLFDMTDSGDLRVSVYTKR
jgi:hypothetical protein